MSSYRALTYHPEKKQYLWAEWRDDYYSQHHYGVTFDGIKFFNPRSKKIKVKKQSDDGWFFDPLFPSRERH